MTDVTVNGTGAVDVDAETVGAVNVNGNGPVNVT